MSIWPIRTDHEKGFWRRIKRDAARLISMFLVFFCSDLFSWFCASPVPVIRISFSEIELSDTKESAFWSEPRQWGGMRCLEVWLAGFPLWMRVLAPRLLHLAAISATISSIEFLGQRSCEDPKIAISMARP